MGEERKRETFFFYLKKYYTDIKQMVKVQRGIALPGV